MLIDAACNATSTGGRRVTVRARGLRVTRGLRARELREGRDLRRGVDACKDLTMRFFTTLICNDCNTAEGKAKGRLGDLIPSYFSFSPREITRFIRVQPNRMHGIDDEAVREVWNEVARDVADRLAFLDILAGRLRAGGHRIQGNPPQFWSSPVLTSVLPHLAARQGQDAESLYRIPGIVSERSVRHDGFGVSPRLKRTASRVDRRGKGTPLAV